MSAPQAFPQTEPNDSDSVADALDAGLLHWVKGEKGDALRCLRLARSAADDAGDDQRALALARAAAELTTEEPAAPITSAAASSASASGSVSAGPLTGATDSQSTEPRRSRLPEPPTTPKKFTGATESAAAPATKVLSSRSSVPTSSSTTSIRPLSTHAPEKNTAGNGATASFRPSPPSARPAATPSEIASSSEPTFIADSATSTAPKDPGNASAAVGMRGTKSESSKVELIATKTDVSAAFSSRPSQMPDTRAKFAVQQPTQAESRTSTRPDATDHRLASLRVKIERVEADGHVRVRLLDLAATASGEDNAILVVPQALWQELKRGS